MLAWTFLVLLLWRLSAPQSSNQFTNAERQDQSTNEHLLSLLQGDKEYHWGSLSIHHTAKQLSPFLTLVIFITAEHCGFNLCWTKDILVTEAPSSAEGKEAIVKHRLCESLHVKSETPPTYAGQCLNELKTAKTILRKKNKPGGLTEWNGNWWNEKTFSSHISDKGLICRIYKN